MRYNRSSIDDTLRVASIQAAKVNKPRTVFATAYGYTIADVDKTPYWQRYYRVYPDGKVCLISGTAA